MSNHSGHFRSFSGIGEVSQPVVFPQRLAGNLHTGDSDELSALADNYEPFEDGKEFTNPAHRYSFDLDLFGRHSLFQALNRTCTSFGKEKLAEWFRKSSGDKGRDNPTAGGDKGTGCLFRFPGNIPDHRACSTKRAYKRPQEEIKEWTEAPAYFSKKWWSRPLLGIVPGVNIVLAMLEVAGSFR